MTWQFGSQVEREAPEERNKSNPTYPEVQFLPSVDSIREVLVRSGECLTRTVDVPVGCESEQKMKSGVEACFRGIGTWE